jgi:hypothetical protein
VEIAESAMYRDESGTVRGEAAAVVAALTAAGWVHPPEYVAALEAVAAAAREVRREWDSGDLIGTFEGHGVLNAMCAALDAAPTPDARLREAVAALRAKTDPHGGVPWLEPELSAVYAALDAVPAETGSGEA